MYLKMYKDSSGKYYQNNKKKTTRKGHQKYEKATIWLRMIQKSIKR